MNYTIKDFFAVIILFLIFLFNGCATVEKEKASVGTGHTFWDLRKHTFSSSKATKNTFFDVAPNGKKLAFVLEKANNRNIYIKEVNGKAMTQKTFHKTDDSFPAISPDGKLLAFASRMNGNWDIFVMNMKKGKAKRQITSSSEDEICPSWSPDGTKIAFCRFSKSSGQWGIWTFNLTNGALTNLVPGKFPYYSPVENTIVFQRPSQSDESERFYALWSIDDLGMEETIIADSLEKGYINPSWSSDGNRVVFASGGKWEKAESIHKKKDGTYELDEKDFGLEANNIGIINKDGTGLIWLTSSKSRDSCPKWSKDDRIYFVSDRDKYLNIWSVTPVLVEPAPKKKAQKS